jgi:hypothetical protein
MHMHTCTHSEPKTNKIDPIVEDSKVVPAIVKVGHTQFPQHVDLLDAE